MTEGIWHPDLQCKLVSVRATYDGSVTFNLPDDNCVDMGGAIRIAQAVMPNVATIYTQQGHIPDVMYTRSGDKWTAHDMRIKEDVK
jgi:hypothetical protein